MKYFFILFLTISSALATDGVVTVLEAPLFRVRDRNSPVVQYLRRGDKIKLHPSLQNTNKYDHMAPDLERLAATEKRLQNTPEWQEDQLFKGDRSKDAFMDDEFLPTLDRNGNEAFILTEHVYVYLENDQEFTQRVAKKDPTDYRLQEPLPKNYPLDSLTGLRGQVLLGTTTPYLDSYPYLRSIKSKGYRSPLDFTATVLKRANYDQHDRLYFGGSLSIRSFSNNYQFSRDANSEESGLRIGVGPTISYDAFKGEKNRLNLYGSVIVNAFNRLSVTQHGGIHGTEQRVYRGYNLSPRLGTQYHRKNIIPDLDFVLGAAFEIDTPTDYSAQDAGKDESLWRNTGNDNFKTRLLSTLSVSIGVQSSY